MLNKEKITERILEMYSRYPNFSLQDTIDFCIDFYCDGYSDAQSDMLDVMYKHPNYMDFIKEFEKNMAIRHIERTQNHFDRMQKLCNALTEAARQYNPYEPKRSV